MTIGRILLILLVAMLILSLTPFAASSRKPDDPTFKPVYTDGLFVGE